MRIRSSLLAGVAGLAAAAFAGSALAQTSWGNKETTYFHTPATSAFFPDRPNAPSFPAQSQPGEVMHFRTPQDGSGPGVVAGPNSQPTFDE